VSFLSHGIFYPFGSYPCGDRRETYGIVCFYILKIFLKKERIHNTHFNQKKKKEKRKNRIHNTHFMQSLSRKEVLNYYIATKIVIISRSSNQDCCCFLSALLISKALIVKLPSKALSVKLPLTVYVEITRTCMHD